MCLSMLLDADAHDQDLADAIENAVARGRPELTPAANLPMGGRKHTGASLMRPQTPSTLRMGSSLPS